VTWRSLHQRILNEFCVTFFPGLVENEPFSRRGPTLSVCLCDANSATLRKLHEMRKKLEFAQMHA
jgi:hypothetical protein